MSTTVYTKPDCPQCDATKKYLNKYGIEFNTVDITENKDAYDLVVSMGYKYTPVVVSNNNHWSGFRPDKISALRLLLMDKGIKDAQ